MVNQDNSLTVQQFKTGDIDGAWVPEPYASELVDEGGATLVDEADLWPDGQFVTTHILVNNDFLKDHADLVDDLLAGNIEANKFIADNSDEAKQLVGDYIANLTGGEIPQTALDSGWEQLTFTNDPIADSLIEELRTTLSTTANSRRSTTWPTSTTSMHSTSCLPMLASRKCQDHLRDNYIARGCGPRSPHGSGGRPSASRESVKRSAAVANSPWP